MVKWAWFFGRTLKVRRKRLRMIGKFWSACNEENWSFRRQCGVSSTKAVPTGAGARSKLKRSFLLRAPRRDPSGRILDFRRTGGGAQCDRFICRAQIASLPVCKITRPSELLSQPRQRRRSDDWGNSEFVIDDRCLSDLNIAFKCAFNSTGDERPRDRWLNISPTLHHLLLSTRFFEELILFFRKIYFIKIRGFLFYLL